jgi:hypothetical protein
MTIVAIISKCQGDKPMAASLPPEQRKSPQSTSYANCGKGIAMILRQKGDITCGEDVLFSRIAVLLSDFDAHG